MPQTTSPGPDTVPTGGPATPGESTRSARHALPVQFSGSGSEYFRIWIVNLLLTLATLGLYYPWAKVRRLRYFHGNTWVGDHALDFHGQPKKMLRGFLLVALMLVLYSVAGRFSATAGLVALVLVGAIWPALFHASLQFRLANTSWRGLRFQFTGGLGGAYLAMLPWFVPALLFIAAGVLAQPGDDGAAAGPGAALVGVAGIGSALLFPWCWWVLKKYQHDHYALGRVQTSLRTGVSSFYGVCLKTAGVALLAGALGVGVMMLTAGAGALAGDGAPRTSLAAVFATLAGVLLFYMVLLVSSGPYFTSRMQNLLWNRTKSSRILFESRLQFVPLAKLTLKNWLLVIVTLGLYWPFAAIAIARLKLEAMTLHTRGHPDEFVARERPHADDAAGDAAADLMGIEVGL